MRTSTFLLFFVISAVGAGQIRGPVQGYVTDSETRAIRAINGIPGASLLSDPLDAGFAVDRAVIDGARGIALAADLEQGLIAVIKNLAAGPSAAVVDGALPSPAVMALSPGARMAAVANAEGHVQRIALDGAGTGHAGEMVLADGAVTALSVDDQGNLVFAAAGGLYAAAAGGAPVRVAQVQSVSALSASGSSFFYADRGANEVVAGRWESGTAALTVIAQERDGVQSPVGLSVSADSRRLFVANEGSATVLVWNLEFGAKETELELASPPTRCQKLGADGVMALNEAGAAPLLLLDPGGTPRVVFVPAVAKQ